MGNETETFEMDVHIDKPPDAVRAWWTDLPEDYRAKDPREQPYRIRTVRRFDGGRELQTFWGTPGGDGFDMQEILRLQGSDRWTFDMPEGLGFAIHDEFHTEPEGDGTRLHIHSTITQLTDEPAMPLAAMTAEMRRVWATAADICARDA